MILIILRNLKVYANIDLGKTAVGIEVCNNGNTQKIFATKAMILFAGAITTPQILMLSGIGPAEHLRDVGSEIKDDLPGVGLNLQDHLEIYLQTECLKPISQVTLNNPIKKPSIGIQWMSTKKGLGSY